MFRTLSVCVALAAFLTPVAFGGISTLYVAPCGDDAWSGTSQVCDVPNGPKQTIQAAIDAASNGITVSVASGTYFEVIDFLGKDISVVSENGPAFTIIDGSGQPASVVTFATNESAAARLEGFTIQNGNGTDIQVLPGPPPVLHRFGGGVLCDEADPTISNCIFVQNDVPTATGGAIANRTASPTISDCQFVSNSANHGGAIANLSSSSPSIRRCAFLDNGAVNGGAIGNSGGSSPTIVNAVFENNLATVSGGAIHNSLASSPVLINCTVTGNDAGAGFGGGLFNNSASPVLTNCILWQNTDQGGADSSAQIHIDSGLPTVSYSCIQGGWAGSGSANTSADPQFVNAGAGDFTLADFSPAIDTGDNAVVPLDETTDLDGNARFMNDTGVTDLGNGSSPIIDMGAFERQSNSESTFVQVPLEFPTIQEGINACAAAGATLEISPGTYVEPLDLLGKTIVMRPTPGPGQVIIDGGGSGHVITIAGGEGPGTRLEDLTIRGGGAPGGSGLFIDNGSSPVIERCAIEDNNGGFGGGLSVMGQSAPSIIDSSITGNTAGLGGGIYAAEQSLMTVANCTFAGNTSGIGGGIYAIEASVASVSDCDFDGNTAIGSGFGGAIYLSASSPEVRRTTFIGNIGINGGAMLIATSSSPNVFNCLFVGNMLINNGGAIAVDTCSSPRIANCAFSGNTGRFGGAVHTGNNCAPVPASVTITNCSFSNNDAELDGGAVYMAGIGVGVANSILWQNAPSEIFQLFPSGVNVVFSDVAGGWTGLGNLNLPPLFVDPAGADGLIGTLDDDLRTSSGSAVIDAASNTFIQPGAQASDLDENPRVVNGVIDMGAYEFQGVSVGCPADLNDNEFVDFADLLLLLGVWGPCPGCPADLDGDNTVGFSDVLVLIGAWGPCP